MVEIRRSLNTPEMLRLSDRIKMVFLGSGGRSPDNPKFANISDILTQLLPDVDIKVYNENIYQDSLTKREEEMKPAALELSGRIAPGGIIHYAATMATLKSLASLEMAVQDNAFDSLAVGDKVLIVSGDTVNLVRHRGSWHLVEKPDSNDDLDRMLKMHSGSEVKVMAGVGILEIEKTDNGIAIVKAISGTDIAGIEYQRLSTGIYNELRDISAYPAGGIPFHDAVDGLLAREIGFSSLGLGRELAQQESHLISGVNRPSTYPRKRTLPISLTRLRGNIDPYQELIFMKGKGLQMWLRQILNNHASSATQEIMSNTMELVLTAIYEKNMFPELATTLDLGLNLSRS